MDQESKKYFVIYSAGSKVSLVAFASEASIIENAERELRRESCSFASMANVFRTKNAKGVIEPIVPFTVKEKLMLSVKKLSDRGRAYAIFPASPGGARAFLEEAEKKACGRDARRLIAKSGIEPMK